MSRFRDLVTRMDDVIFSTLNDDAILNGNPVRCMFYAPWLGPETGTMATDIPEPHIIVRHADAEGIVRGDIVEYGGEYYDIVRIQPDGSGVTAFVLRPQQ